MKKALLGAVVAIFFVACDRDKDDVKQEEVTIAGTWKTMKYVIYDGKDRTKILQEIQPDACDEKDRFTLLKDGKVTTSTYHTTENGECKFDTEVKGTYKYDSMSKIISVKLDNSNEMVITKVLNLTANTLEIIDDENDENKDGVNDIHTTILTRVK